jgi:g-D-glutamyl-meso-diaminopimelate peptidase
MDYESMLVEAVGLPHEYKIKVIGKTKYKRKIIAVERVLNKAFDTAIFLSSIHARENITTDLVLEMIKRGCFDEIKDLNLAFILMANPDGVKLQNVGLRAFPKKDRKKLVEMNGGSEDFSMWKANARGVDINNNFDARFGTNVGSKKPASQGFVGKCASSEKETKAIVKYTRKIKPFMTVSYHSKGEEIYYNFFQRGDRLKRDKLVADMFAKITGYKIKNVEKSSSGGYKDWCVQKLKIPALTIEVGSDELLHPIGRENLEEIFDKNKNVAKAVEFAYNVVRKTKV